MQALIATSRSINQDLFFTREVKNKYKKHLDHIGEIISTKPQQLFQTERKIKTIQHNLTKAKSAAKLFREKQEKLSLKKDNLSLLKRIWKLEPKVQTATQQKFQFISGSNWNSHRKRLEEIREQNKLIGQKVVAANQFQAKDFKKKMQLEIRAYLELRDNIRKIKPHSSSDRNRKNESQVRKGEEPEAKEKDNQKLIKLQRVESVRF